MANYECETRRCARLNFFQDRSSWIEVVAAYSRRWHQPCHTVRAHLQAKPSRDLAGAPPRYNTHHRTESRQGTNFHQSYAPPRNLASPGVPRPSSNARQGEQCTTGLREVALC